MPRAGFELLEHTADLGIRAWGSSLPEAFEQAARGLVRVMGIEAGLPGQRRVVKASADDEAGVLVALLNELIWLHEAESVVFGQVEVIAVGPHAVMAEVDVVRLEEPPAGIGVKAATYHQLAIVERPGGGVEVRVFLDV